MKDERSFNEAFLQSLYDEISTRPSSGSNTPAVGSMPAGSASANPGKQENESTKPDNRRTERMHTLYGYGRTLRMHSLLFVVMFVLWIITLTRVSAR